MSLGAGQLLRMTTQFRALLGHKLFIVIVFYKNILCFENASSSCRVVNLKFPISGANRAPKVRDI